MPCQNLTLSVCLNFSLMEPLFASSDYFLLACDSPSLVHYSPFHLLLISFRIFVLTKIENPVYTFIQKSDSLSSSSIIIIYHHHPIINHPSSSIIINHPSSSIIINHLKLAKRLTDCFQDGSVIILCTNALTPYLGKEIIDSKQEVTAVHVSLRDFTPAALTAFDILVVDSWEHVIREGTSIELAYKSHLIKRENSLELIEILPKIKKGQTFNFRKKISLLIQWD